MENVAPLDADGDQPGRRLPAQRLDAGGRGLRQSCVRAGRGGGFHSGAFGVVGLRPGGGEQRVDLGIDGPGGVAFGVPARVGLRPAAVVVVVVGAFALTFDGFGELSAYDGGDFGGRRHLGGNLRDDLQFAGSGMVEQVAAVEGVPERLAIPFPPGRPGEHAGQRGQGGRADAAAQRFADPRVPDSLPTPGHLASDLLLPRVGQITGGADADPTWVTHRPAPPRRIVPGRWSASPADAAGRRRAGRGRRDARGAVPGRAADRAAAAP